MPDPPHRVIGEREGNKESPDRPDQREMWAWLDRQDLQENKAFRDRPDHLALLVLLVLM